MHNHRWNRYYIRFGGDHGCIIKLENDSHFGSYNDTIARCMNMNWITNYSMEDEYLWIGGNERVRISNIIIIEENRSYEDYFECMSYFDAMITGILIRSSPTEADYTILSELIQHKLGKSHNNYDKYINDTFRAYCNV